MILKNEERIKDISIYKIDQKTWKSFFNEETIKLYLQESNYKKFLVKSKEEQEKTKKEWRKYIKETKTHWNKDGDKVFQPFFKRDSKGQCRIQCGTTKKKVEKYLKDFKIN